MYDTFKSYRLGNDFAGCDCCVTEEDSAKLHGPISRLSLEDLERYSRKALYTWGTVHHFKHFLPRLFELTIDHWDQFMDLAVVFGKLATSDFTSWPKREQQSVNEFLDYSWEYHLNTPIHGSFEDRADSVLCAIGRGLPTIQRFLDRWLEMDGSNPRKHLAAFILGNDSQLLKKGQLSNAFWIPTAKGHIEVLAWLQTDDVAAYLGGPNNPVLDGDFVYAWPQLMAIRSALKEFQID
jgi:hypothetical protein